MSENPDLLTPDPARLLADEVTSIYLGLAMMEEICKAQDKSTSAFPPSEGWEDMVRLREALIEAFYNFFVASQHPFSSPAVMGLAMRHSMPSRMWERIESFLNRLQDRLPETSEIMTASLDIVRQKVEALLKEVPCFEGIWKTWLENLSKWK
jgi:hypothetical protein